MNGRRGEVVGAASSDGARRADRRMSLGESLDSGMILLMARVDPRIGTGENHDRHKGHPQRKVRIADEVWDAAKAKAGVPDRPGPGDRTMTWLIEELLQAYVEGRTLDT